MGVYRRPDSDTYWMSLKIQGDRQRQDTGVRDRQVAHEIFAAWQVQLARERWLGIAPPPRRHTMNELLMEYEAKVTPRKSVDSQRRDRGVLSRFRTLWGSCRLEEVGAKRLEDYLADRLEEVTFASASKELGILKAAYAKAIRWGWTTSNPLTGLRLNQEGEERIRWLTDDEEAELLAACPPWLRDLVSVGLDTGLRRSNLVGLQWPWVQESGTVLVVPRTQVKAKKRAVVIPLTRRAARVIAEQSRHSGQPHVFTQSDGKPYHPDRVGMAVIRAARQAGLADVSLHVLRHTFISRLVQAGRPLPEVAALAGHRDITMTMRYAHLAPRQLRDGIEALESRIRTSVSGRQPCHAGVTGICMDRVSAGGPNGIRTRV
jgi:integrase